MVKHLYNERILKLAAALNKDDRLKDADASVTLSSPICGSRIKVDVIMDGDKVGEYGQQVRACALGQSAAAIMAKHVVGQSKAELRQLRDEMQLMLREDGVAPTGHWDELEVLMPAKDFKSRHASIMLPFNAIVKVIEEAEGGNDA